MSKKTTSKQPAKRRGRPKGSRNINRVDALEIPAACPKCSSCNLKVTDGQKTISRDISGVTKDGMQFARIEWINKHCTDCGQHVRIRRYCQK